jgi:hypothetical protein
MKLIDSYITYTSPREPIGRHEHIQVDTLYLLVGEWADTRAAGYRF